MGRQMERTGVNDETTGGGDHHRDHERGDTDTDSDSSQRPAKAACPAGAA